MTSPSLWDRLRSARIVQALGVYLGASWVVLQIIETVTGLLALPAWVGPVAVLLLAVGLLVVLATAWVQSLPQTTAAEEAGEVPTDWEVAPSDVIASLKAGRLPHLTWGRAIVGGVVALSLLFGAAGVFVLVTGGNSFIGTQEAGAESASSGIAVLPFHVTGPDLEVYREGMVDLVSANLDGLSDFRAIDARTVLARWNREIGETADAELQAALRVAGGTGARYAVVGSGVEIGGQVRFTADVYDLADGSKIGDGGQVEGSPEQVLRLVDELTVKVMRSLLDATGQASAARDFRLASLLTASVPALRHYLVGDAAFRRSRFGEARESLEQAIVEDSTFALAHWRLGETLGWTEGITSVDGRAAKEKARRYGDRLPAREATLLTIGAAIAALEPFDEMTTLRNYTARYPDDPDGWYLTGEVGLHNLAATGLTDEDVEKALYTAVELDPTFGPYFTHAIEWASAKGQADRFRSLMAGHEAADADPERRALFQLRWDLLQGSADERAAATTTLNGLEGTDIQRVLQTLGGVVDENLERVIPMLEALGNPAAADNVYMELGRFAESRSRLEGRSTLAARALLAGNIIGLREMGDASLDDVRTAYESIREGSAGSNFNIHLMRALTAAALQDRAAYEAARDEAITSMGASLRALPPGLVDADAMVGTVHAALEGLWAFESGDAEAAYQLLSNAPPSQITGQLLGQLGVLAIETERWREAIRIFEGVSRGPVGRSNTKFRLGQAYEAVGETENALAAYRLFLSRWENADPDLTWLREAREAVARLGGSMPATGPREAD